MIDAPDINVESRYRTGPIAGLPSLSTCLYRDRSAIVQERTWFST